MLRSRRWSVVVAVIASLTGAGVVALVPDPHTKAAAQTTSSPSAPPNYDAAVLEDQPVAYWAMNEPGTMEPDLTANGHSGSYVGGTPALVAMPNGDRAVDFNGINQYLHVSSGPALSIPATHELTWEGWIRPDTLQFPNSDSTGNYVDWMGKCQNYSPNCEWEARMYNTTNSEGRCNRLSAYVFNPSAGLGSAADWQPTCGLLQSGQWLYVVGEYQTLTTPTDCSAAYPGTINVWVNGVEWDQAAHTPTGCMSQHDIVPQSNDSPLDIGTMALDSWFEGAVGKVAIYDYLLDPGRISAHFTAMTGATPLGNCASSCEIPVPTQVGSTPTTTTTTTNPTTSSTTTSSTTTSTTSTTVVPVAKRRHNRV